MPKRSKRRERTSGMYLVETVERVERTYSVPANSEHDARRRFEQGEYHHFIDNDITVEEIVQVTKEGA